MKLPMKLPPTLLPTPGLTKEQMVDVVAWVAALEGIRPKLSPEYDGWGWASALTEQILREGDVRRVDVVVGAANAGSEICHAALMAVFAEMVGLGGAFPEPKPGHLQIWAYGQQAAVQQAAMVPRKRRRGRPSYNALPRDIEICRLVIWACREFREEGVRPTRNRADRRADLSPRRANRAPSGVSIVVAALARNGVHLVESSVREHVWFGWVGELVRADMHFCSL